MKKLNLLYLLSFLIMAVSMQSCEEELTETVYSELLATTAYETEADAEALILSVYTAMRGSDAAWGSYYWYDYLLVSESGTDTYGVDAWGGNDLETGTFNNANPFVRNLWEGAYKVIGAANFAIEVLETMPIDDSIKNEFTAEAKFLRGLAYYDLTFNFGDVILNLGEPGNKDVSPQAEIIAQIIQDLTDAAAGLGDITTPGRASKGAALGIRAKTHLNAKNWTEAANDAKAVMDLQEFGLVPTYEDVWDAGMTSSIEWIFAVMSSRDGTGAGLIVGWFTNSQGYVNGSWGRMTIAPDYYRSVALDDDRRALMPNGYTHGGGAMDDGKPRVYALPGTPEYDALMGDPNVSIFDLNSMMTYKYLGNLDRFVYSSQDQVGANYPILRYADILLTRAEGLNETGDTPGALMLVNEVRARSNAALLAGLDQSSMRDAILEERGIEFYMEGHRRLDLIRNGNYADKWRPNLEAKYTETSFGYINNDLTYFPIPQSEIDANDQLGNE